MTFSFYFGGLFIFGVGALIFCGCAIILGGGGITFGSTFFL
jgi:hypothetical protein